MAWVYILKSDQDGRFYIGSTSDLKRRIRQHQQGHTQTTNRMGTFHLVLSQEYRTLEIAREIERKIKRLKRKDYLEQMIKDGEIKIGS